MKFEQLQYIISRIAYDVFLVSFCVFVISFLLESQWSGVVARWININMILIISFLAGFVALLTAKEQEPTPSRPSYGYWIGSSAISIAAGWIVWRMSLSLGIWAFIAAAGVSLIILLMSGIIAVQSTEHE
ncbi:hypothetical protein HY622_02610 [Candidatus Uhrbacteria bacterium]|nr:hypothetical protein [Candidatus Uhrbacteria bacterium]